MAELNIAQRLHHVNETIAQAEATYGRAAGSVKLLAVSKGHPASAIEQAFLAGQRDFGESYLQESLTKIQALAALPIQWHWIGPIQSNKTKAIACHFDWVHSLCRSKIALQLNDARPNHLPPLNVCLQLNLDNEDSKSGISSELLTDLVNEILQLPRLQLRGLMIIPQQHAEQQQQYLSLLRLTHLFHALNQQLSTPLDTLSMGMSNDIQAAIHAGSTMVRIGTAIFGERANH